jgi:soluble lytic murein transglycosylase
MTSIRDAGRRVYGRALACTLALLASALAGLSGPVAAQGSRADAPILEASEALRKKDRVRLAAARDAAIAEKHPLAMWADYWELGNRLGEAQQAELEAFYARWSGSYVEDRLRNDWLLELGKRRDWANFALDFPRFRMNDDREVTCYALLVDHLAGKAVREAALAAWLAQREADDGCALMATRLFEDKQFGASEVWRKARVAVDANRPRAVRQAVALLNPGYEAVVTEFWGNAARWVATKAAAKPRAQAELTTLALMRMAANDAGAAAGQMIARWDRELPADLAAWAWATVGKQSALDLLPDAADHYQRAQLRSAADNREAQWPDETFAWKARAALRADEGRGRWQQVVQAINAMAPATQADPTWVYWKARALHSLAGSSQDGASMRELAAQLMAGIAGQMHFYGKLAADHLGQPLALPPAPQPLSAAELQAADSNAGLARALRLIVLGLRSEGVREWNFSLRGMADRELLAAAQLACDREVWDRCINTSDRTRTEIDMAQRFPTPFRREVQAQAREIGVDAAYVYGLIRQESRFIMDARSGAGASGLMQLMPATARWTARKIGMAYTPALITDRDTNIRLGTTYLKLVLDDFDGSPALAAAAYNAGPSRPRKWRDGPRLEAAVWAENIPFTETRDYVKKVLSNTTWYAALLGGEAPMSMQLRLGAPIGPRADSAPPPSKDLP